MKNAKRILGAFGAAVMLCSLNGCGSGNYNDINQSVTITETQENNQTAETETIQESNAQEPVSEAVSGEDLDVAVPNPAADDWYMKNHIYIDDNGRRLEVFFNDEGTLEFAIDGLSVYFTSAGNFQQENNAKIYTCDDGTMIAYYPENSAHPEILEIADGDYEGLYKAGGDKVK